MLFDELFLQKRVESRILNIKYFYLPVVSILGDKRQWGLTTGNGGNGASP
jgi:hypothetical protein